MARLTLTKWKSRKDWIWMNALVKELAKRSGMSRTEAKRLYHKARRFFMKLMRHGYLIWRSEPFGGKKPTFFKLTEFGEVKLQEKLKEISSRRLQISD